LASVADLNAVTIGSVGIGVFNADGTARFQSFELSVASGDSTAPAITALNPDGISGVYPGTPLVATFSEDIALTGSGTITIEDTAGSNDIAINVSNPSHASVSGNTLTINPPANLAFATNYEVWIGPGTIQDTAATPNTFPGTTAGQWTFSTAAQDLTAPAITLKSPLDNASGVSRAANIVATFDDDILTGSGNITLKDLDDGSTTRVIPVSDESQVSISGKVLTIDPTVSLAAGKNYAVQIAAGAVNNFSDVGFAGIAANDDTTWNFETLDTSPNVIFILGDDQAWHDYGFMQRPGVEKAAVDMKPSIPQVAKTPAIDRLADGGLAFIHGYSAPVCRPALASMITGTYLQQHWITGNDLVNSSGTRIDDSTVEARMQVLNPLPRTLFNQLGYTSFQTGKWWEGHHTNGGFTHGDTVNSIAAGTAPPQWSGGAPSYIRARHGDWGLMTGRVDYVNDIAAPAHPIPYANTVQTVTDFINTQVAADQPFFLWYAPFLPHDPFDPPAGLVAEYTALGLNSTDAKYYANIERFDGGVDAILDHLDSKGIADHTIIILICDNGRALDFSTVGKLTPYDSGVRSPIIVRWPDRIKPGGAIEPGIIRTPVSMVDMVPTVHHALGLPTFPEMRGIDLLDPAAIATRDTVCGSDHDVEILELSNPTESLESRFAVRDGWKLILFTNGTRQLFHLYDGSTPVDPHETTNLAASNPQLVAGLTMEIVNWYAEPNNYNSWIGDPALGIAPADRDFSLDLDGDGLTNGVEAWFGTDPRAFTAGLADLGTNGTTTTFTHPRNPQAPGDLAGSYEWSPNLVDWYAGNGVDGPAGGSTLSISAAPEGSHTTVTATASAPVARLFIRARVTRN
jgi:arylsulfatase A-like enzyme